MSYKITPVQGTRIYLCGPMTGIAKHNYPLFNETAETLRKLCLIVYNPAENFNGLTYLDRKEYMRIDLTHILQADVLVVLPGWAKSAGASLEVSMARELGLPVWRWLPSQELLENFP